MTLRRKTSPQTQGLSPTHTHKRQTAKVRKITPNCGADDLVRSCMHLAWKSSSEPTLLAIGRKRAAVGETCPPEQQGLTPFVGLEPGM